MAEVQGWLCEQCAAQWPLHGKGAFRLVDGTELHSLGYYRGSLRKMIVRAKEEPAGAALRPLVAMLAAAVRDAGLTPGVLVAPPSSMRRRWRGWHLAGAVAAALAWELRWPHARLLRRRRQRPPQAGLGAAARRRNLDGSFAAAREWRWPGAERSSPAQVWVLDDVMTTGATLAECRRVLLGLGASQVGALVLARVAPALSCPAPAPACFAPASSCPAPAPDNLEAKPGSLAAKSGCLAAAQTD